MGLIVIQNSIQYAIVWSLETYNIHLKHKSVGVASVSVAVAVAVVIIYHHSTAQHMHIYIYIYVLSPSLPLIHSFL